MLSENMASLEGERLISLKESSDGSQQNNENNASNLGKKTQKERSNSSLHWFAQVGDDSTNNEGAMARDRDEKIRLAKERQNEERQKKIEELRAQAEAAQRYREQKEEERRRRIEDLRHKENDRRHQVEERKRAIIEAEKERRDYILRKNQERDARLDTKRRNERSSIVFAFGSSTPRLLDPVDMGTVSPSALWGQRRSTSITNISYSGATLTRRSSERELNDGSKKRATSAGGVERSEGDRRSLSTSMYEVFNWGFSNDERPKNRIPLSLAIGGGNINIDGPPTTNIGVVSKSTRTFNADDTTDSQTNAYNRSVYRRKTDLMPTIPSPRESSFGSRTSVFSHTPRTPGRAVSMTRLDQLAQPIRRNGEHLRAVIERERQQQVGVLLNTDVLIEIHSNTHKATKSRFRPVSAGSAHRKIMSRSMNNLTIGSNGNIGKYGQKRNSNVTANRNGSTSKIQSCKSMVHLATSGVNSGSRTITRTTTTSTVRTSSAGSRSGDVTPGGSFNTSRPGSAMSTSTTASGFVQRRPITVSTPQARKPRPISIAVTGVSLIDDFKQKKDKPPLPKVQNNTPKRGTPNTSMNSIKSSTPELATNSKPIERKSSLKKESPVQKSKPLSLPTTGDSTPIKKPITPKISQQQQPQTPVDKSHKELIKEETEIQTKAEKEALNSVKIEQKEAVSALFSPQDNTVTTSIDETVHQEIVEAQHELRPTDSPDDITITTTAEPETVVEMNNSAALDVSTIEEKADNDTEKVIISQLQKVAESDRMTASMIERSKITTEEEAKAALAERRRFAREEAERQAELERQRLEAEHQAELLRQAEEEQRQRKLEEETLRLVEEQRKAEDERLLQAIEEAKKREEAERLKREEDERMKVEKEEADRKAKEEAEKQRLEVAERLKKEEKEREERRKRVEAIMSRTRKAGGGNSANSTPTKDNENAKDDDKTEKSSSPPQENDIAKETENAAPVVVNSEHLSTEINENQQNNITNSDFNSTIENEEQQESDPLQNINTTFEKSVTDKENALIKTFSNLIVDDQQKQNFQNFTTLETVANGKASSVLKQQNNDGTEEIITIANGNGHSEIINTKNETLTNIPPVAFSTEQLIDFSLTESQQQTNNTTDNIVNFNNNSLITTTTPTALVTSDSHDNKDISLL